MRADRTPGSKHSRKDSEASSVISLLFDMELDEDRSFSRRDQKASPQHKILKQLTVIQEELPQVWKSAGEAHAACTDECTGEIDLLKFASHLASAGYTQVWLRTGCTDMAGSKGIQSFHKFIVVELSGGELVIVDPHFWEQFDIAAASDEYKQLLKAFPPVFAGNAEHVSAVSALLCAEMEAVFAKLGHTCPPWRTHRAMVSRWLVTSATDVKVEAAT